MNIHPLYHHTLLPHLKCNHILDRVNFSICHVFRFNFLQFLLKLRVYKELSQTLQKFGQDKENEEVVKKIRKLEKENHEVDEDDSQNLKEEEHGRMEDLEELLLSSGNINSYTD